MRVLVADDHMLILEGYKNTFKSHSDFVVDYAKDCDSALMYLKKYHFQYDIVVLDEVMPSTDATYASGGKIARMLKEQYGQIKVIFVTSLTDTLRLYNIMQEVDPDGFISKGDCTPQELIMAINIVKLNQTYLSSGIRHALQNVKNRRLYLDNVNRQILFLLGQGVMTKNLPDHLPLSMSALQKRKSYIKLFFNVEKESDEQLLKVARQEGFL